MSTNLVMLPDRSEIEIDDDAPQAMRAIATAARSADDAGFAQLTRTSDGKTIFVAVDKILYVEPR